ncbi:MAG TPA: ComEC/Rec2 family competence protein [Bacillota bacterium]|nr:ComEC/Rec2 family competence protein [Bacillota bacterium]
MNTKKIFFLLVAFIFSTVAYAAPDYLAVHFLDVGQADCTLIKSPAGQTMLLDTGDTEGGDLVVKYLTKLGVKKIDILVGTCPGEAHLGGMPTIIKAFPVNQLYLPKTPDQKIFKEIWSATKGKKLKPATLEAGMSLNLDFALNIEVLAPNAPKYTNVNDYSTVIKVSYGKTSFLFTGAAGRQSETEMLTKGYNLKSDLLKVSQHGSNNATTPAFLKAVAPKYAVISVASDQNDLPHPLTVNRLEKAPARIIRTDRDGTIVAASDGERIQITTVPMGSICK